MLVTRELHALVSWQGCPRARMPTGQSVGALLKGLLSLSAPKLFTTFLDGAGVDFIDLYDWIMGIRYSL